MFVVVYGLYTFHDRLKLWEDLRGLDANAQGLMLYQRDYSAILKADDRPQGRTV